MLALDRKIHENPVGIMFQTLRPPTDKEANFVLNDFKSNI